MMETRKIMQRRTGGLGGTGWRQRGRGVNDRDQLTRTAGPKNFEAGAEAVGPVMER